MKEYRCQGTITVFLSLISVLFLSLLCTSVESARMQGSRAKAAAALDMGLFSVFGEFENGLLEKYDLFFLDGAQGTGSFSTANLNEKLKSYMKYNVQPNKGMLLKGFDPFALSLEETQITGIQLATDENGAAFYQQAVRFMKENMGTELINELLKRNEDARKMQEAGELYEQREKNINEQLEQIEAEQKEKEEQMTESETEVLPAVPEEENPLSVIGKLKKQGLMKLVLGEKKISDKTLGTNIPSGRMRNTGNLDVEKEHSGLTADLLFQEYLFQRFSLFTDEKKEGVLDYELEYILCGKNTDEKNLKSVITRLLLLREGTNFLYLVNDPVKKQEADGMAMLLTGWIPIAGVQAVTSYALLLAWAYGESLLDVRELLAGGSVPLLKEAGNWKLSLEQIPDLLELLEGTDGSSRDGVSYEGYLQILFTLGSSKKYPMRALDMIEGYLRTRPGLANFRADYMVSKIEARAHFKIPPVFLKISNAFLKTGITKQDYEISGSFAY